MSLSVIVTPEIHHGLEHRGTPPPAMDLQIASHALSERCALVTVDQALAVLKDDGRGLTDQQHMTELTYLLLLKIVKESGRVHGIRVYNRAQQLTRSQPIRSMQQMALRAAAACCADRLAEKVVGP